jgi:hypothetical protein
MHRERFRRGKFAELLSVSACALLCVLAIQMGLIHQPGVVQASALSGQGTQDSQRARVVDAAATDIDLASTSDDDDGPSPGNFLGSTYVPTISSPDQAVVAAAPPPPPPPTPVPANAGGDAARQQINNDMANLLAMAYALKTEVDKTNQDQLSISVVRKAGQIEQMARKMRDELRPSQQSKN